MSVLTLHLKKRFRSVTDLRFDFDIPMTPSEFWQNFKLGQEQEIAANFIYDGLRNLHVMRTLGMETEIFPVLYNLSIGLERLFKVAIVLLDFDDSTDIDKFEKGIKTHDHPRLLGRIEKDPSFKIGPVHKELLGLLSVFYDEQRYDRFRLQSLTVFSKDKKAFLDFLHKHLGIDIKEESSIFYVQNSPEVKTFIGKLVKDIVRQLYESIRRSASAKNLSTDEISSAYSKAAKVLLGDKPIVFENEDVAMIELLIFLMKTKDSPLIDFMKTMKPLPLDPALDSEYLQALLYKRPSEIQNAIDEIESHHEDVKDLKDRLEAIKAIKDPDVSF